MHSSKIPILGVDELFLRMAYLMSLRSTCLRLNPGVGVVIVRDKRVIVTGCNGPLKNHHVCSPESCDLTSPCIHSIHAEANAIYYAAKEGIPLEGCTMYITHSPCPKCCEAIVQSGIKEIKYGIPFRDTTGLLLLSTHGIKISQVLLENPFSISLPNE